MEDRILKILNNLHTQKERKTENNSRFKIVLDSTASLNFHSYCQGILFFADIKYCWHLKEHLDLPCRAIMSSFISRSNCSHSMLMIEKRRKRPLVKSGLQKGQVRSLHALCRHPRRDVLAKVRLRVRKKRRGRRRSPNFLKLYSLFGH